RRSFFAQSAGSPGSWRLRRRVSLHELRHASSDRLGALDVQEMARAINRQLFDVWERRAKEVGDLHPQGRGTGAQDGENGPVDRRRLLSAEVPFGKRGQLDAEEGVRVPH